MSAASPGANASTADTEHLARGLRHTLRKLWQTAAVWTLVVAGATAWWAQHALEQHRQDELQ